MSDEFDDELITPENDPEAIEEFEDDDIPEGPDEFEEDEGEKVIASGIKLIKKSNKPPEDLKQKEKKLIEFLHGKIA